MNYNPLPLLVLLLIPALAHAQQAYVDPYKDVNPTTSIQDTVDEPLRGEFSIKAAADYLDRRAHLVETNCYACHSTFTYLPARSLIDPLADEVMRTRILLERLMTMTNDPKQGPQVKTPHLSRLRLLAPLELARHDAATTGRLASITRQSLDAMWKLQKSDGGIDWIHVREAPQAIDDWWPAVMIALGVAAAPEGYASTEPSATNLEKLRGWFRSHPPQTLHERSLTLVANSAIGGILNDEARAGLIEAVFAKQHEDGGWSMPDMAPWQRKDKKLLDPTSTDGYATGLSAYAIVRGGVLPTEPRLQKAIAWIKTHQRESGGWFTQSPFARDKLASNTGTSFAIQALAACGEITPPKVTPEQFATAHAKADAEVPAGQYEPKAKSNAEIVLDLQTGATPAKK
ncbi:MAG: prenyltransferase/squalene oxidase repeat-containing protein [Verrucomicrobiota bacterium]